eukprot:176595_1
MAYAYLCKVIVVGDFGVGKSRLILQFMDGDIDPNMDGDNVIGVEFGTQTVSINNEIVKLQMWDTAGQETFRSITHSYYRNTAGALLVYDITQRKTFTHLPQWLNDARTHGGADMSIVLVGNKCDLEHLRQVSTDEGQTFAQENGLLFTEISAQTSNNAFIELAQHIYQRITDGEIDPTDPSSGVLLPVPRPVINNNVNNDVEVCCHLL